MAIRWPAAYHSSLAPVFSHNELLIHADFHQVLPDSLMPPVGRIGLSSTEKADYPVGLLLCMFLVRRFYSCSSGLACLLCMAACTDSGTRPMRRAAKISARKSRTVRRPTRQHHHCRIRVVDRPDLEAVARPCYEATRGSLVELSRKPTCKDQVAVVSRLLQKLLRAFLCKAHAQQQFSGQA